MTQTNFSLKQININMSNTATLNRKAIEKKLQINEVKKVKDAQMKKLAAKS